jgi:hypothetical protein
MADYIGRANAKILPGETKFSDKTNLFASTKNGTYHSQICYTPCLV